MSSLLAALVAAAVLVPPAASSDGSSAGYVLSVSIKGDDPGLEEAFRKASLLGELRDRAPDGRVDLERRLLADERTALDVLRSRGYYAGTVRTSVDWKASPVPILLEMTLGPLFTVGGSRIVPGGKARALPEGAPVDLSRFGLAPGDPAVAEDVLAAVEAVPGWFQDNGYPDARTVGTAYRLYPSARRLDPEVGVDPGAFSVMGEVRVSGTETVDPAFVRRLAPWTPGRTWSRSRLDAYRDALLRTELFREVEVRPGGRSSDGRTEVEVGVKEGPRRRIGGGLDYDSGSGAGAEGAWEHRNLFGAGEWLRLGATLFVERQELSAAFVKPAFLVPGQSLVADAFVRNEQTDAYDVCFAYADAGLARRFGRGLRGGVRLSAQGGSIREDGRGWDDFLVVGAPASVRYDATDSLLEPTTGWRIEGTVAPYGGEYRGGIFLLGKVRGSVGAYLPLTSGRDGRPDGRLVAALRVSAGCMVGNMGGDLESVPGSLRYHLGGGGSVRGYEYQGIGPRGPSGDPSGGLSFTSLNMELRWKATESLGIVPFVDCGAVYARQTPDLGRGLRWSAGIGLRWSTPVGPVRADLAFPLDDRSRQSSCRLYLSIGQAF